MKNTNNYNKVKKFYIAEGIYRKESLLRNVKELMLSKGLLSAKFYIYYFIIFSHSRA